MKLAFAVAAILLFCYGSSFAADERHKGHNAAHSASADSEFHTEMQKMMDRMHQEMKQLKMSGDVDADFARMMIVHHKGAIEMAELQRKYGRDVELKGMNEKSSAEQKKEIQELQKFAEHRETR